MLSSWVLSKLCLPKTLKKGVPLRQVGLDALKTRSIISGRTGLGSSGHTLPTLQNVTVVENYRDAAYAVKKLIELDADTITAWSTSSVKSEEKQKDGIHFTASAYVGSHIEFANGPYLHIRAGNCTEGRRIWALFREYLEDEKCLKIWLDNSVSQQCLTKHAGRSRGSYGDLRHMAFLANAKLKDCSLKTYATEFLDKKTRQDLGNVLGITMRSQKIAGAQLSLDAGDPLKRSTQHQDILAGASNAFLIQIIFEALRKSLLSTEIQGINCSLEFQTKFTNLLDVYVYFYVPLVDHFHDMQRAGIYIDKDLLRVDELRRGDQRRFHEQNFRQWASGFSNDAFDMDIHCTKQLRQLLFAPCTNIQVKTKSLPSWECFQARQEIILDKSASPTIVTGDAPKSIIVWGRGAKAQVFTSRGWPSTSTKALRKAAGFPRNNPPSFGQPDKAFCLAVDDLLQARALKDKVDKSPHSLKTTCERKSFLHYSHAVNCGSGYPEVQVAGISMAELREGTCAQPGNILLCGEFSSLPLRLLGQLSQCESLIGRLGQGGNIHEIAAVGLFEAVENAVNDGTCDVDGAGLVKSFEALQFKIDSVAKRFPSKYLKAKVLDDLMERMSTEQHILQRLRTIGREDCEDEEEDKNLIDKWRDLHPGVREWQARCIEFCEVHHFVETMLGRRFEIFDLRSQDAKTKRKLMSTALRSAVEGSCGEVVSGAVISLGTDEILRALQWRVMYANSSTVVLEGPQCALEVAAPIVRSRMTAPFSHSLDVSLEIELKFGDSLQTMNPWHANGENLENAFESH